VAISKETHDSLIAGIVDYYKTPGGKVVTFGNASVTGSDTEFALMPLCSEEADKILALNA